MEDERGGSFARRWVPKLSGRRLRMAMPSALVGLVAFSFTLLFFGAAVYTAAVPSMIAQAQAEAQAIAAEEQAAEAAANDSDANYAGTGEAAGEDGGSSQGGSAPGGASLGSSSLSSSSGLTSPGDASTTDAAAATTDSAKTADTAAATSQPATTEQPPVTTSALDPEEEAAAYAFMAEKAGLVNDYVAEVNACVDSFSADALNADISVRQADKYVCDALYSRLYSEWNSTVNYSPISNKSQYKDAQVKLVVMYRCLATYVGCYQKAWTQNLAFPEPAGHEDEFMAPLTNGAADAAMQEFQDAYDGFSL